LRSHTNGVNSSILVYIIVVKCSRVFVIQISIGSSSTLIEMSAKSLSSKISTLSLCQVEFSSWSRHLSGILWIFVDSFNSEVFYQISCELVKWNLTFICCVSLEDCWELSVIWLHVTVIFIFSSWETRQMSMPALKATSILKYSVEFLLISNEGLVIKLNSLSKRN